MKIHRHNIDLEPAMEEVCHCDKKQFFRDYIYGGRVIDFNRYLKLIGLRSEVQTIPAVDDNGQLVVDLRVVPLSFESEGDFKVRIMNPESIWAKAGIRTGDTIISADERKISTWQDFRGWLGRLKIGDTARVTEPDNDTMNYALAATINGIAAGLRNTG